MLLVELMPTSTYFPSYYGGYSGEQNLVQDLVDEQIKLFGTDIYYLPRTILKDNTLSDVIYSKYEEQFQVEMILQNVEGFGSDSEFITKFGLKVTDEVKFAVSQRRWVQESGSFNLGPRPLEGDLLFFPLTKDLYEIKYVEVEAAFHQLGKLYFYQITAEIYEIGNEKIDTGIDDIDLIDNILSASITLTMAAGGTGDFVEKEEVVGANTGTKADVVTWDSTTRELVVVQRDGTFEEGEVVAGATASWQVEFFDTLEDTNTKYDQNKYIEDEGDGILDFSEKNPFGEYGNFMDSF